MNAWKKVKVQEKKTLVTGLFEAFRYLIVYQYIKHTFSRKKEWVSMLGGKSTL